MANSITSKVSDLLAEFLKGEGYELYHIEYLKEGKDWYLRVYIDKAEEDEYISTDDCEKVSRYLDAKLDEEDLIDKNYYLEVSSPGMDRELITEEHFKRYIGRYIDVKLYKAYEGEKILQGELISKTDDSIAIKIKPKADKKKKEKAQDEAEKVINLPTDTVAKVRLAVII